MSSLLDIDNIIKDDSYIIKEWITNNCNIYGDYSIINNEVYVDGNVSIARNVEKIPIKFKEAAHFSCQDCAKLESLKGGPEYIREDFICKYCENLISINLYPKYMGGFICELCAKLKNLNGLPDILHGDLIISYCEAIKSFEGISRHIEGKLMCTNCNNLSSLDNFPQIIGSDVILCRNKLLKNQQELQYISIIKGNIYL